MDWTNVLVTRGKKPPVEGRNMKKRSEPSGADTRFASGVHWFKTMLVEQLSQMCGVQNRSEHHNRQKTRPAKQPKRSSAVWVWEVHRPSKECFAEVHRERRIPGNAPVSSMHLGSPPSKAWLSPPKSSLFFDAQDPLRFMVSCGPVNKRFSSND